MLILCGNASTVRHMPGASLLAAFLGLPA